jgi:GPH family glycoside/pentoside/hexuronide:cation symporter
MPHTIIPDSIDYGEYLTGERQEGLYFGFLTFIQKVGTAGAIGASGIILQFAGYNANAVQSQTVLWTIRILFGPVPGLFLLIGIVCIYFYPIDKKMFGKIHNKIQNMRV